MSRLPFSLPEADQTSSKLLQLPAEIRLNILRHLMKREYPLADQMAYHLLDGLSTFREGKDPAYKSRTRVTSDLDLSAQFLRCCQLLYQEASGVLFDENSLAVFYTTRSSKTCLVADLVIPMPPDVIRDAEIVTDLVSAAERPLPHSGTASNRSSRTREIYPSLLEFRHLAVYIESCEPENVASFFRTTRDFVANRNVSIRNMDVNSRYVHTVSDALQWSSYWRCKSITFPDNLTFDTSDLIRLTTGLTTVIDMVAFAKTFFRVVTDYSGIKHNDPRYRTPTWLVEIVDANMPPPAKRYNTNDLSDLLWPSIRAGNKTEFCRLARIVLEKLVEVTQKQTEEAVQDNIDFARFIPDSVERIVELRVKQREAEESISSFLRDVIGDGGPPRVVEEEPLDGGGEVGG